MSDKHLSLLIFLKCSNSFSTQSISDYWQTLCHYWTTDRLVTNLLWTELGIAIFEQAGLGVFRMYTVVGFQDVYCGNRGLVSGMTEDISPHLILSSTFFREIHFPSCKYICRSPTFQSNSLWYLYLVTKVLATTMHSYAWSTGYLNFFIAYQELLQMFCRLWCSRNWQRSQMSCTSAPPPR